MTHNSDLAPKGPSRNGYRNGCRCDGCVQAGQGLLADRRGRHNRQRTVADGSDVTFHGISAYQRGCRCKACTIDYRDAQEARKTVANPQDGPDWDSVAHLMPGAGVRRRTA